MAVDTVRNALNFSEAELRGKGIDQKEIKDAFEEMRSLAEPVSKRCLSLAFQRYNNIPCGDRLRADKASIFA